MTSGTATRILGARWYPGLFRALALLLLAAVVYFLWFGPAEDERNPGTILVWYLWWPSLWFSFLLLGRLWCGLCPFPPLMRLAQRLRAPRSEMPVRLRDRRPWLLFGSFLLLHLVNLRADFEESVGGTLALLLAVTVAALATALLVKRRAWCAYLCPMGAMAGMMSMNSALRLEADAGSCGSCVGGPCREGCGLEPAHTSEVPEPPILPRDCDLCGHCVKVCPAGAVKVRLNPPGWALWSRAGGSSAEGVPILLLLGIVLGMGLRHMGDWPLMLWRLGGALSAPIGVWGEAGLLLLASVSPLALFSACAAVSAGSGREAREARFRRFSLGVYPLALAGMIAVSLKRIVIAAPMGVKGFLFGHGIRWGWLNAVQRLDGEPLTLLSMGIFLVGVAGCLTVWRKTDRGEEGGGAWPFLAFAAVTAAAFLWVLSHPMLT